MYQTCGSLRDDNVGNSAPIIGGVNANASSRYTTSPEKPLPDDDDRATLTMEDHLSLHPEDSFCEECGGAGYIGEWIHTCYACNGTGRTGAATNDDNTDDGEEVGL